MCQCRRANFDAFVFGGRVSSGTRFATWCTSCYGGDGNGPNYTQPGVVYKVTGGDPYGLDSNHDGSACG